MTALVTNEGPDAGAADREALFDHPGVFTLVNFKAKPGDIVVVAATNTPLAVDGHPAAWLLETPERRRAAAREIGRVYGRRIATEMTTRRRGMIAVVIMDAAGCTVSHVARTSIATA